MVSAKQEKQPSSYLFKDILAYKDIRNPNVLSKLLTALALQLGNEVSYHELSNTIGIKSETVENYIGLRTDAGALWENFMVSERKKHIDYEHVFCNRYFWRTHAQHEIDYIEEHGGVLNAFEFKCNNSKKAKIPPSFASNYPEHKFECITPDNYIDFFMF